MARATPSMTPATPPAVHYVALGDSYSSGVGAGGYTSASGSCDRTPSAFPQLWANANAPASFTFAACSGATTQSVISGQLSALSAGTTLVSVTAGGNDAGFSNVMETCVLGSQNSCLSTVSTAEKFVAGQLPARLDTMLADIRDHAPSATIVVLGYPDLYDVHSGFCIGLSGADRNALNQGANMLDAALAAAASASHDKFADVRTQFSEHEICDSGSWLHSVDIFDISSSYHPTAAGQQDGYLPAFERAARS
ncbi:MAG TPA: SGNH/GDSL hydrolase family protein [Streptosporangiaceae bacterium]